ncbi:MAG TPA: hypothetical protein VFG50_04925, partial [Rhodothermales bacterium]|nr:hypothetical protein [Rhodothermales bacterium]
MDTAVGRRRSFVPWLVIAGGATIIGLVFVLRYYLYSLVYSEVHFTLKDTVWMVVGWWMWILIAPIVLYLARR